MRGGGLSSSGQRPELVGTAVLAMVVVEAAWTAAAQWRAAAARTAAMAKMVEQV